MECTISEIYRIETLVQNLLKITRLDSGSILIEPASETIAVLMKEIRQSFELRMKREEKTIALSGAETATLFCDRVWMSEAISNLLKKCPRPFGGGRLHRYQLEAAPGCYADNNKR